jgi:2-polyprenyl-6-methoxyphenol hydroxylase-like FAD-dependent oxidoreductase
VAALARWGILERLEATNCPPITRYSFDFGPVVISGSPRPAGGAAKAYCPRRIVLDAMLVEAAVATGADLREAFTVEEILVDDGRVTGIRGHAKGGATVTERARAVDAFATYVREDNGHGWAALPTHDDLTCVIQGWPQSQFAANRKDLEVTYMYSFELAPEFAVRINHAKRETRFVGTGDLPGFFLKPYGPGWALLGDAGYHKHPITAFGITDAFRDAEAVASALDDAFAERRPYDDAMADYQRARDEDALSIYELTCEFAKLVAQASAPAS